MSGAPLPNPEVLIERIEHRQNSSNTPQDDFALEDDSDEESIHTSAIRRFSRRESKNAERVETAGILSNKERRASRSSTLAPESRGDLRRRGSNTALPDNPSRLSVAASHADVLIAPNAAAVSSVPAYLGSENTLASRRYSRTSQNIHEERANGLSFHLPEPAFTRDKVPVIKEVDTVPPTPAVASVASLSLQIEDEPDPRATGTIASWRGSVILATACFAQLIDNIWMTSINIAVPRIAEEFELVEGSQSWLVSAYTLTFGGFLLLAGVLSDRFGRRFIFCGGMVWMAIFSVAAGVSTSGVQCIIFRALQGMGAAASVPSAIGVLSNFFIGNERHRAMSMFGAAGAVGFVVGLIMGGILTGTLGWRYIFYINAPLLLILAVTGWFSFPDEVQRDTGRKPSLDFLGAALGTSGMVLMTFALSQSEVSGWGKPIIYVTLIVSVLALMAFAWTERKVSNPIMPTYLWKLPSFAGIWCSGFLLYCWWASMVYYLTLISQEVLLLSPLLTGVYMIPMGFVGFVVSVTMGYAVERFQMKHLMILGFLVSAVGTLPAAFVPVGGNFWRWVFPTTLISVVGVSISYNVASIALVSAVPPAAKSLAGGLINTAFQIGSGFGLAITSVVNESVLNKALDPTNPVSIMAGYQAALFTSCGLVGGSLLLSIFTIRDGQQATAGMMVH